MPRRDDPTRVLASMIQLAQAPDFGDEGDDDDDEGDDDEYMDDEGDGGADESVDKGKPVHGPRTKLSASFDRLIAENAQIRKSNAVLARGMAYIIGQMNRAEDDDDKDDDKDDDWDDKEDKAVVRKSSRGRKVDKDDAASNFGEQDSNTPGNRPFDPAGSNEEDHTVIQGGPSAGPGPTSGGVSKALQRAIAAETESALKKALANPNVMTSGVYGTPIAGGGTAQAAMGSTLDNAGEEQLSPFDSRWLNPKDEHGRPIMSDQNWFERANQLRRASIGLWPSQ